MSSRCLREGEDPFVPMVDAARALHRVAERFPVLLTLTEAGQGDSDDTKETHEKRIPRTIAVVIG